MNTVIQLLTEDHAHFRGLLEVLRIEAARIEAGEPVWFDLLDDIVDYLHDYAEGVHHPVEERLMLALTRAPSMDGALQGQHAEIERSLEALRTAFTAVQGDHPQRREPLIDSLNRIADRLGEHIDWEEAHLFDALAVLDERRWLQNDADGGMRCCGILIRPLAPRFQSLLDWQRGAMRHAAQIGTDARSD
jgi:hemerythrin-like domain-containing protein